MLFENLRKKEEGNEFNELKELLEKLKGIDSESEKRKEEKSKEESSNDETQFIKDITLAITNVLTEQAKMIQQGKKILDSDGGMTPFKMKYILAIIATKKYTDILFELISESMDELSKHSEKIDKEYMENMLKCTLELHSQLLSSKEV